MFEPWSFGLDRLTAEWSSVRGADERDFWGLTKQHRTQLALSNQVHDIVSMRNTLLIVLYATLALGGCTYTTGPSKEYPLQSDQIKASVERMEADPKGVDRPVVVIDGWTMIGGGPTIRKQMIRLTGGTEEEIINYSYLLILSTMESNASKIIDMVEERWPSDDPEWTTEVDVIGYSMGGVIGRVAAMPPKNEKKQRKRLKVKSLYTIGARTTASVGGWGGSSSTKCRSRPACTRAATGNGSTRGLATADTTCTG